MILLNRKNGGRSVSSRSAMHAQWRSRFCLCRLFAGIAGTSAVKSQTERLLREHVYRAEMGDFRMPAPVSSCRAADLAQSMWSDTAICGGKILARFHGARPAAASETR